MNEKNIIENHRKAKFPSFPSDDSFAEWVEELIELDAYYYGLALSCLSGELKLYDGSLFQDSKQKLLMFKNLERDKSIYRECEEYLESLSNIVDLIKAKASTGSSS
jgi:hypothetical protein